MTDWQVDEEDKKKFCSHLMQVLSGNELLAAAQLTIPESLQIALLVEISSPFNPVTMLLVASSM